MEPQVQTDIVQITPVAIQVVRGLLAERNLDESYALRVYVAGRTCSGLQYGMALDNKPSETDQVFEQDGIRLLIDDQSIDYMRGATIDFVDDGRGKGFVVDNPNVLPACSCESGSCGC
jgi:iron-sulfur cluster assembly accessory protein